MQALQMAGVVGVPHHRVIGTSSRQLVWALARGWQATLFFVLIGVVLGGYLGAVSSLYAWTFGRKIVLNDKESARRRTAIGLLTIASATVLYSTALSLYVGLSSL